MNKPLATPTNLDPEIEAEIARLIEPGVQANAFRADIAAFRERRIWNERRHARRARQLDRELRQAKSLPVLDLGCGRGGISVALALLGYRVVAADLRQRNLRITHLRGLRYGLTVPALRGYGEALPLRSRSLGAVVCRDVLEHCNDPRLLIGEIWRVLRPGGWCFVTVINRRCWVDPHYHLAGLSLMPTRLAERYVAWRRRGKPQSRDRQRLSDMHYFLYAEFTDWMGRVGFQVRDLQHERLATSTQRRDRLRARVHRRLAPLSLHANHFEFLLRKPKEVAV